MLPFLEEPMTIPGAKLDELSKKLLYIAMRVKTKSYLNLALKLIEFARLDALKDKDEAIKLIKEVAAISKSPLDMHHKKRNEIIERALEELKKLKEDSKEEARKTEPGPESQS